MPLTDAEKLELKEKFGKIGEAAQQGGESVEESFLSKFREETHEELVLMLAFTTISLLEVTSELNALKQAIQNAQAKRAAIAERDRNGPRIIT